MRTPCAGNPSCCGISERDKNEKNSGHVLLDLAYGIGLWIGARGGYNNGFRVDRRYSGGRPSWLLDESEDRRSIYRDEHR